VTDNLYARCVDTPHAESVVQGGLYRVIGYPTEDRIEVMSDLGRPISYARWRFEIVGEEDGG